MKNPKMGTWNIRLNFTKIKNLNQNAMTFIHLMVNHVQWTKLLVSSTMFFKGPSIHCQ
jgi:hypothetical protein